jgi:DNA polymerase-1
MTLLIDADWLIYNSCCACEEDTRWTEHEHTLHSDERDIMNLIDSRIDVFKTIAGDKHDIVMCFTSYPTFRHEIFPEYKIHRIGKRKPLALRSVINNCKKIYDCVSYPNLEGDDVLGLLATNGQYKNPIIVSVDKDMRTIPCKLIAAEEVEHITEKKANRHWFEMSIAGDSTDGIVGVKGTGMVTATKLLADTPDTIDALWSKVAETYTKKGYTLADAILNARLTRILREGDYDYNTGTVKLWNP